MSAQRPGKQSDIPAWEWAVAGLGLLIFLSAIGFFLIRALGDQAPPEFVIRVDSVRAGAVSFTVENSGDLTAADVVIGAVDRTAGPTITFDFVPARSKRSGVLVLTTEEPGQIPLRVHSFIVP